MQPSVPACVEDEAIEEEKNLSKKKKTDNVSLILLLFHVKKN